MNKGILDLIMAMPPEKLGVFLSMLAPRKENKPELHTQGYRAGKKPDMYTNPYKELRGRYM